MRIVQLTRRAFVAAAAAQLMAACGSDDDPTTTSSAGGSGAGGGGAGGTGTGGAGGSGPTDPGPEPDPWEAPGLEDLGAFAWGVQTGDAMPTSVLVSARTLEPSVAPTVMKGIESGWEEVASGQLYDPVDGVVHFELTDLVPDTTYSIALYGPGGVRRSRILNVYYKALRPTLFDISIEPAQHEVRTEVWKPASGLGLSPWHRLSQAELVAVRAKGGEILQ